jgi:hypothetical protein
LNVFGPLLLRNTLDPLESGEGETGLMKDFVRAFEQLARAFLRREGRLRAETDGRSTSVELQIVLWPQDGNGLG